MVTIKKGKKKLDKKSDDAIAQPLADLQQDIEARRTSLKALIVLGKERGYLTYAEINDHLPDMLEVEQIESVASMINDMGIRVCDVAPDAEALIMTDSAPTAADEDAAEEAEPLYQLWIPNSRRTTDPVRMYMREWGTVDAAYPRKRIEIAKRIEEGPAQHDPGDFGLSCDHCRNPALAAKIEIDEIRVNELIDGFVEVELEDKSGLNGGEDQDQDSEQESEESSEDSDAGADEEDDEDEEAMAAASGCRRRC